MCSSLTEWIDTHPAVPKRPRGERRHYSIYLSDAEGEAASRVLADSRLWSIHDGQMSELVRHALGSYLPGLMDIMEDGYRPIAELMRADIEKAGLGQTIEQIHSYLDTRGQELIMLLDLGELNKAFEHYEHVMEFVRAHEGVWATLLLKLLYEHGEITTFRDRARRIGAVEEARLRMIEEVAD